MNVCGGPWDSACDALLSVCFRFRHCPQADVGSHRESVLSPRAALAAARKAGSDRLQSLSSREPGGSSAQPRPPLS